MSGAEVEAAEGQVRLSVAGEEVDDVQQVFLRLGALARVTGEQFGVGQHVFRFVRSHRGRISQEPESLAKLSFVHEIATASVVLSGDHLLFPFGFSRFHAMLALT